MSLRTLVRSLRTSIRPTDAFVHHLRAALAVASIVTLLHSAGLLGWLDGLVLRIVGAGGSAPLAASYARPDLPVVMLISKSLYEREFAQSSPLSRNKLAQLIRGIPLEAGQRPASVVIDLDLSPSPRAAGSTDKPDIGSDELDSALLTLLSSGARVVLPLPVRVATPESQDSKFRWLQSMCRRNTASQKDRLIFAIPDVSTHQGVVMQWDSHAPSLGRLTADPLPKSICDFALEDSSAGRASLLVGTLGYNAAISEARREIAYEPFNAKFFAASETQVFVANKLSELATIANNGALAGKVLFIGGAYDDRDRYAVPFEPNGRPVEGVIIHAATYYSALHPVSSSEGLTAFAMDLLLGIAMGYCFAFTWGWHQRISLEGASCSAAWWKQAAPRFSLLVNIALVGFLVAALMVISNRMLYPVNVWINPGPIIIGVFAKFALASRRVIADPGHAVGRSVNAGWMHYFDTAVLAVLVVAALADVVSGH